jgi:hypothetical protein
MMDTVPLSALQRIWLADQQERGGPMRGTFAAFRLDGPLRADQASRALDALWVRHDVLRTTVERRRGRLCLVTASDPGAALSVIDGTRMRQADWARSEPLGLRRG